nr:MAG TPA: hypothetical protein [Caudoviricetes sp.]
MDAEHSVSNDSPRMPKNPGFIFYDLTFSETLQ